ncbi:MAG: adenosylmethionine--8-amino-7-oxononanoate transaminase [Elusimicrobia bacterium]|nr:adenosylmethionine--8-amino-7-oxononanoate transaminase [Elusimicrobiota bacterium]
MDKLLEKDKKYIWHPYTQMKDHDVNPPIVIERAKGIKLYGTNGKMYYDTISSWWCNIHGHNHPKIKAAIKKQIDKLDHVLFAGFTHKPAILLSEKLISLVSDTDLRKVFYSDNGSTSVEVALKMSLQYWKNTGQKQKKKFVHLGNSYHGDTVGAMSVSDVSLFNENFSDIMFDSYKVPSPYCYRCHVKKGINECKIDCIVQLEKLLKDKHNEISAFIIEPLVQAAGGMIIYPKEYIIKAYKLCKKYKIHLILDEVATGFGRTGKMFAYQYTEIKPDFLCISKGITSGYLPLGVTITTDEIYSGFYDYYEKKKTFYHGHTYTANPISCATALASLEIFEEENTLFRIKNLIPIFHRRMEEFRLLAFVGDVRYIGMIGAIELVKDKKTKIPFAFEERIGMKIYKEGIKKGIILRPLGNVIYLYLPLSIKRYEMTIILDKMFDVIKNIK